MTMQVQARYLIWDRGTVFYARRTPPELRLHYSVDGRKAKLKRSLKTSDPKTALKRRDIVHINIEAEFDLLHAQQSGRSAIEDFKFKAECAVRMGFAY